jgi:hypothetical protein
MALGEPTVSDCLSHGVWMSVLESWEMRKELLNKKKGKKKKKKKQKS